MFEPSKQTNLLLEEYGSSCTLVCFDPITVNLSLTVEDAVGGGVFRWDSAVTREAIVDNFRMEGVGAFPARVSLLHLGRDAKTQQVEDALLAVSASARARGLRPWKHAGLGGLRSFTLAHPLWHAKFPILGLGSVAEIEEFACSPVRGQFSPMLTGDAAERLLYLRDAADGYRSCYRFLLVEDVAGS